MKFKGVLVGQASGSVAGNTFSRNAGGQYIRVRAMPTNPGTERQVAVRNYLSELVSQWNDVLDSDQRNGWAAYAANVLLNDRLGEPRNVGAIGMYVRSNVPRLVAGLAVVNDAPTTFNLGDFSNPVFAAPDVSAANVSVAFTNTDTWASEVGSAMLVFSSRGQNPSINYFKGPYQYAGRINGAGTPPTTPQSITIPTTFAAGQRVFFRVVVSRADGRLSSTFRAFNTAVP